MSCCCPSYGSLQVPLLFLVLFLWRVVTVTIIFVWFYIDLWWRRSRGGFWCVRCRHWFGGVGVVSTGFATVTATSTATIISLHVVIVAFVIAAGRDFYHGDDGLVDDGTGSGAAAV